MEPKRRARVTDTFELHLDGFIDRLDGIEQGREVKSNRDLTRLKNHISRNRPLFGEYGQPDFHIILSGQGSRNDE